MAVHSESPPLILGEKTYQNLTEDVARTIESKSGKLWGVVYYKFCLVGRHAGTLISAVLLLFRWRLSINRSAEAMTIFAVVQAGLFTIIHMGRPWDAFWVIPIPNNFNSPLLWDVFAISTYFSGSGTYS